MVSKHFASAAFTMRKFDFKYNWYWYLLVILIPVLTAAGLSERLLPLLSSTLLMSLLSTMWVGCRVFTVPENNGEREYFKYLPVKSRDIFYGKVLLPVLVVIIAGAGGAITAAGIKCSTETGKQMVAMYKLMLPVSMLFCLAASLWVSQRAKKTVHAAAGTSVLCLIVAYGLKWGHLLPGPEVAYTQSVSGAIILFVMSLILLLQVKRGCILFLKS